MLNNLNNAYKSIIGTIIKEPFLLEEFLVKINIELIYDTEIKTIFDAMSYLSKNNIHIDKISIESKIMTDFYDESFLLECISMNNPRSFDGYIKIIKDEMIRKELTMACTNVIGDLSEDSLSSTTDSLMKISNKIGDLLSNSVDGNENITTYKALLPELLKKIKERKESDESITGQPTGINDLDELTSGWQDTDLIILAARPSMGKTSAAMGFVETVASKGDTVYVFSIEMPSESLIQRSLSSIGSIEQGNLKNGNLTDMDLANLSIASEKLHSMKIIVDDSSSLNISEMRLKIKKYQQEHPDEKISLVMVDYLQLMNANDSNVPAGNKNLEVSHISRGLKKIAKDFTLPVIALSQLNRTLEQRADKRPMNSDLRDSGSIEQDADVIVFIYRDEVYNEDTKDKGVAELIIGKQRNGSLGTVKTKFEGKYCRFSNIVNHDNLENNNKTKKITAPPPVNNYSPTLKLNLDNNPL